MVAIKDARPGRLEIREGGGCLMLFGLPFFGTGIFMVLASFGVVTMRSDGAAVTQAAALGLGARITIPMPPLTSLVIVGGFFPAIVATSMLAWLGLFSSPR
jgi:hypothetical protein